MAVSKALRYQILRRDNHTCRYCGRSAPEVKLTVDHVVPETLGGTDDPTNLVAACADCNNGKNATPPDAEHVAQVADDATRWAEAIREAAAGMLADHDARAADREQFRQAWDRWGTGEGAGRQSVPLPPEWGHAVDRFVAAGLPLEILIDSIDIAMTRKSVPPKAKFNYLCGIGWNKVTELQTAAHGALGGGYPDPFDWDGAHPLGDDGSKAIDRNGRVYDFEFHVQHPACTYNARHDMAVDICGAAWSDRQEIGEQFFAHAEHRAREAAEADRGVFFNEADSMVRMALLYPRVLMEHLRMTRRYISDLLNEVPPHLEQRAAAKAEKAWREFAMKEAGKYIEPPETTWLCLLLRGLGEAINEVDRAEED